jgi:DNA-binding NarL/FixJ family response regulator
VDLRSDVKVLIVDDHPIVRMGVRRLIETEWPQAAVDEADTIAAAVEALGRAMPHIVIST